MSLNITQTDNPIVARMAIAWSIAATKLNQTGGANLSSTDRKALTDAYIEAYNAILANERSQPRPAQES